MITKSFIVFGVLTKITNNQILTIMEQEPILNEHNKQEYPPMHTAGLNTSSIIKRMVLCIVLLIMAYSVSAQQRMYPIPKNQLKENKFDKKLSRGFGIDNAYKFVYQVEPSFTTEYCLSYDSINKSLLLCKSKSKIGYALKKGESKEARKKRVSTYQIPVDDAFVDSLQSMFCEIINSASSDCKKEGLDGTSYLFYLPTDIYTVADTWEPDEESNCGRAVRLMEQLCEAVEKQDSAAVEQLREEIMDLTAVFRRFVSPRSAWAQQDMKLPDVIFRTFDGKHIAFPRVHTSTGIENIEAVYESDIPFTVNDTTFLYRSYSYWRCDTCQNYQLDSSSYYMLSHKLKNHKTNVYNAMAIHFFKAYGNEAKDSLYQDEYDILKSRHPKLDVNSLGNAPRIWYSLVKYNGAYCFSIDNRSCIELTDSIIISYYLEAIYHPINNFQKTKSGGWSYTTADYYDSTVHVTITPCSRLKGAYIMTYSYDNGTQENYLVTNEKHIHRFDVIDYKSTECREFGLGKYEEIDFDAIK